MITIKLENAEKELAALIERARAGEEIMITDGKEPGVRLTLASNEQTGDEHRPAKPSHRGRGILKGKIKVSDEDLFGLMPEDELKRWYGESDK